MSSGQNSTKTSVDIWHEILEEKRSFKGVLRALIVLLAIAALIALGMFYYSYETLTRQENKYLAEFQVLEIRNDVARGDAARERQTVLTQTLDIKEQLARAAKAAVFNDMARRVEEEGARQSDIDIALEEARLFTSGASLDVARFALVREVKTDKCSGGEGDLPLEMCLFLEAVSLDWGNNDSRSSGSNEPSERLGVDTPVELINAYLAVVDAEARSGVSAYTPYAHAGLAQLYYAYADNEQLGVDADCRETVRAMQDAIDEGFEGIGPYLLAGECLRRQGRPAEAHGMFSLASAWYEDAKTAPAFKEDRFPPDVFRMAYHGEGTTMIAMIASDQFPGGETEKATALRDAERNLERAASLRRGRGEGDIGGVYTTENIGFIYVISEDWASALYHTEMVNNVLPLTWNLVVRRITGEALYDNISTGGGPNAGLSTAEAAREIACEAEQLLINMKYEYFYETEMKKLLPSDRGYGKLLSDIIEKPRAEYERRKLNAEARREILDTGSTTTGDTTYYGTEFCRPETKSIWDLF
ncbi:MAG: hypothetical protein AAFY34_08450 [Pseudomonadota bacterium]